MDHPLGAGVVFSFHGCGHGVTLDRIRRRSTGLYRHRRQKLVQVTGDEGEANNLSGLDCLLCATVTPPPVSMGLRFAPPSALSHAFEPMAAAHIAAVTSPPLPSRGPPIPKI